MANFELNPFQPLDNFTQVTSIVITSNSDVFDLPEAVITGPEAIIPIDFLTATAHTVMSVGPADGIPTMRLLEAADIPNIALTQVTGLQASLNALVKTLVSTNTTAITISNNAQGDFTVTPNFGTLINTIAQGNDSRFPASVTGLRKGAGAGSLDTAAVAKTDYWNTDVFVASGASHAKGLVPDPGASAGTTKFLREDATWVTPSGAGTVTSIAIAAPSDIISVTGSPVTGSGTITLSKADQNANRVFAGPTSGGSAAPAFRSLVVADIPTGTSSSTVAIGNDTRFSASVSGIRKSSGAGSTDVAAVKWTDYWDNSDFIGIGPSNKQGLVPTPGNPGGSPQRYLREDATWQLFIPGSGSLSNSMLSVMAAKTIKANATGSSASPTDVDAKTARSSSLLNLESITTFGNADYNVLATDRYVSTSVVFTATRTVTLPLANTFNAGQSITISDDFGAINGAFVLNIAKQGADTIQGSASNLVLEVPKGSYVLSSDGSSKWFVTKRNPAIRLVVMTGDGTYTTPTGCKALFVQVIGGGGGGAGAQASASNASAGSGGGGGGYATKLISSPASSYAVTVGQGGPGGAGLSNGTDGENTDFGGVAIAQGGLGGSFQSGGTSVAFSAYGGGGGSVAGDSFFGIGSSGDHGMRLSGTAGLSGRGGAGAAFSGSTPGHTTENNGRLGANNGGGGSGALSLSANDKSGGDGAQGVVIITEYY